MYLWWIVIALVAVGGGVGLYLLLRRAGAKWRHAALLRSQKEFRHQRERLEAVFFQMARAKKIPRGLRWADIEFEDAVAFARDRRSRGLSAFVGVTVRFEAIEGDPMEEVEAVGNLKLATAVFHYRKGKWDTDGKTLFNLNPHEAIQRYQEHFELVSQLAGQP